MHARPDSPLLRRDARGISLLVLVHEAPDLFPACSGMAGRSCSNQFARFAASESEHPRIPAPRLTQEEYERHLPRLVDVAPDTSLGAKALPAPSCSHQVIPDRNSFAFPHPASACPPNAELLGQAFRHLSEQTHRSMAGRRGEDVISTVRRIAQVHAPDAR